MIENDETLGEFLISRARRASDSELAWRAIGAALAAGMIVSWRGPGWDLRLAIATCLLAFGMWGIADRDLERDHRKPATLLLRATRRVVALLGFGAFAYLLMAVVGRLLGRIIS